MEDWYKTVTNVGNVALTYYVFFQKGVIKYLIVL